MNLDAIARERSKAGEFFMIKNYNQNELTRHFTVTHPKKQGDNIVYTVSGRSPFK